MTDWNNKEEVLEAVRNDSNTCQGTSGMLLMNDLQEAFPQDSFRPIKNGEKGRALANKIDKTKLSKMKINS